MKINNFKIIIITPYKTGSTTLSKSLQNDGFKVVAERNNDIEYLYRKYNYFIVKGHTAIPRRFLNQNDFDVWFTIIRKPTEIYPSAYFQEIINIGQITHYGDKEKVLGAIFMIMRITQLKNLDPMIIKLIILMILGLMFQLTHLWNVQIFPCCVYQTLI